MTKKNTKKEKTPGRLSRMWTALTGRTSCVVVGICFSIFLIFLASSFVSFVMSGGADNSLIGLSNYYVSNYSKHQQHR